MSVRLWARVRVFAIVSHCRQQAQNHCHDGCHLVMVLLLRGAIDQRFLTTGNTATVMEMMVSGGNTVVENGGAASGCLVLIMLLILLMLTTAATATTSGTATATSSAPRVLPLTFGRWLLMLLLLLLLAIATVRHGTGTDTGNTVAVDRAERLMILWLLAVDGH